MATFMIVEQHSNGMPALGYSLDKSLSGGTPVLINMDGIEPSEHKKIDSFFKEWNQLNNRTKNKQFHGVISGKYKTESFDELLDKAIHVMDSLGYDKDNHPMVFVPHDDNGHNHIHIITSRIGSDKMKIKDNYEGKRANEALNLIQMDIPLNIDTKLLSSYRVNNRNEFAMVAENIYGVSTKFGKGGFSFIDKSKKEELLKVKDNDIQLSSYDIKNQFRLKAIFEKYALKHNDMKSFSEDMKKKFGVDLVFFKKEGHNQPYGYSVIDHKNKSVHKGSSIVNFNKLDNLLKTENIKTGNTIDENITGKPISDKSEISDPLNNEVKISEVLSFGVENDNMNAVRIGRYDDDFGLNEGKRRRRRRKRR